MNVKRMTLMWGDIPYIGENQLCGRRPVIVISGNICSKSSYSVICIPCTTKMKRMDLPCHVKLKNHSIAHVENIITISKSNLGKPIRKLETFEQIAIEKAILQQLGFIGQ